MKLKAIAVLCSIWPTLVYASPSVKEVNSVLAGYRTAKAIQAKVIKVVTQELIGSEAKSHGTFFFSKGKMRLEITDPDRTVLVYDGKTVWFESRADEEHVLVTKMRADNLRRSDSLLAALFDRKDVLNSFNLKGSKSDNGSSIFTFDPKDKKKSDVQSLEIALKGGEIQRISYKDKMDNRVSLEFSQLTKGAVPSTKFAYKPPKNAEITEI